MSRPPRERSPGGPASPRVAPTAEYRDGEARDEHGSTSHCESAVDPESGWRVDGPVHACDDGCGGRAAGDKPIDFAHDIAPLIKAHCAKCHTDGNYKGSFSLDTREAMLKSKAVVPGKSGESELIERLTSDDPEFRMPPKGQRLTRRRGRPAQGRGSTRGCPGSRVHVQADRLRGPAEAPSSQAAARAQRPRPPDRPHRRRLLCRAARYRRPRRWTTRPLLGGRSST